MTATLRPGAPAPRGARLVGLGEYRPTRIVTNDELALRVETSDEWIRTRTGIATRHIAGEGESVVDMAAAAGGKALAAAGLSAEDLGLVILATASNPSQIPGGGPSVAYRLGAVNAGALDLNAGCAGFCYAVGMAADAVRSGSAEHVLVVGSERLSDWTDWDDRSTCVLLADGAGAVVVGPSEVDEIGPAVWGHNGARADTIIVPGGDDQFFHMQGQAVYRWAVALAPVLQAACSRAGVRPDELVAFVPHQANLRIIEALVKTLGAPQAIVARDVVDMGNTSSASIPLALARLLDAGEVQRGDPLLIFAFGAGLTYCGQVVRCP